MLDAAIEAPAVLQMPKRPYPGLRPFEDFEAGIFFGRERHRNRLLEILQRVRFLAVVGPSGSGKSSLVRAGLLPVLPLGAIGTGPDWHVATMRPGNKPLRNLAIELLRPPLLRQGLRGGGSSVGPAGADGATTADITRVETALRRGPHSLVDLVVAAKGHAHCSAHNVLVLVDQFEELFTYAEAGDRQADESDAFVNLLLAARDVPEARLFVVITMRTDFLGHCVRFLDLPEALNHAQYLTPRLSRDEIRDAISQPALTFGGGIDAPLVEELINAVQENADQLPVLQHALARMWERAEQRGARAPRIVNDDLLAVGGVNGALSKHGEQLLRELDSVQRLHAEWLFRAITAERSVDGGGQRVRRPQTLARIAAWSGQPWQAFVPVIKLFSQASANFVTYRGQPGEPADGEDTVLDLAHESLMRQWATLAAWVSQESSSAGEYRRLGERMDGEKQGRSLLTGGDLQGALEWLRRGLQLGAKPGEPGKGEPTAAWALRYDGTDTKRFAAVTAFIQRSDKREKLGKYTLRALTVAVVVASVGMALLGTSAYREGLHSQAASLWSDIRVRSLEEPLPEAAVFKVHDVARADTPIRLRFARIGVEQQQLLPTLSAGGGLVLRGAVGLDDQLRSDLAQQLRKLTAAPERNRVVDAMVLGLLGESVFGDWQAAFAAADSQQASALAENLGNTLAALPRAQYQQWMDQLSLLTRDPSLELELDSLQALAAAVHIGLQKTPGAPVGDAVMALHELMKRLTDRRRRDQVADRIGGLATRLQPAELQRFAAEWSRNAVAASDPNLLRVLAIEARVVAENLPAPLVKLWAETLLQAATQSKSDRLWSAMSGVGKRLKDDPQTMLFLLQTALGADLRAWQPQGSRWLEQLITAVSKTQPEQAYALALRIARVDAEKGYLVMRQLSDSVGVLLVQGWQARLRQERQAARGAERELLAKLSLALDRGQRKPVASGGRDAGVVLPPLSITAALRGIRATTDPTELSRLGEQLAAAVARLVPAEAPATFEGLLAQIKLSDDSDRVEALGKGLGAAAERASPGARKHLIRLAMDAMKQPATNAEQSSTIAEALQPAVAAATPGEAGELGNQLLTLLLTPPKPADATRAGNTVTIQSQERARRSAPDKVRVWRTLMIAVSQRLAQDPAALAPWTRALMSRSADAKEFKRSDELNLVLAAAEGKQPQALVAPMFDQLLDSLPTVRSAKRAASQSREFSLPDDDDADDDEPFAFNTERRQQSPLHDALGRLALRLDDAAAVERIKTVAERHVANATHKRVLLQSLAAGRNAATVLSMQEQLLAALSGESHQRGKGAIASAFILITNGQPIAARTQTATELSRRLLGFKVGDGSQAKQAGDLLSGVLAPTPAIQDSIRPDAALARLLVEACKSPYVDRTKVAAAVRRGEPLAPAEGEGLWEFLRWAVKHYDIAVDKPPSLPSA